MMWIKKVPISLMLLAVLVTYFVASGQLVLGF